MEITPSVLKELQQPIANALSIIFVKSYESGEIPEGWKEAKAVPRL